MSVPSQFQLLATGTLKPSETGARPQDGPGGRTQSLTHVRRSAPQSEPSHPLAGALSASSLTCVLRTATRWPRRPRAPAGDARRETLCSCMVARVWLVLRGVKRLVVSKWAGEPGKRTLKFSVSVAPGASVAAPRAHAGLACPVLAFCTRRAGHRACEPAGHAPRSPVRRAAGALVFDHAPDDDSPSSQQPPVQMCWCTAPRHTTHRAHAR